MDWFETSLVIGTGIVLFAWGRYFYGQPHVLYRYWYDSNRLYVGLSKLAGGVVMWLGVLVSTGILLFKLDQLFTGLGLCLPFFALLCAILFRPIRTKKRPWQEFYKPKEKETEKDEA